MTNCAECCKIIIESNRVYSVGGGTPTTYYFQRNLLGDVVGIYNTSGTKITEYAYDAYGNCTIKQGAGNTISKINPIRYRGYYYDRETNLYYLNSRYYNPEWRRFLSPDDSAYLDTESVNGLNLYCYCNNDPVNYCDPSGHLALATILLGCFAAFAVGSAVSAVSQGLQYGWDNISLEQVMIDGAFSAISVALAATNFHIVASIAIGAGMGLGQYVIASNFHDESLTLQGVVVATTLGAIGGVISGHGAKGLRTLASIYDDMTGRAAQGVKALITAAQRYGFGSKQYALVNNLYGKVIESTVNQGIHKAFVSSTIKIIGTTIATPFANAGINLLIPST